MKTRAGLRAFATTLVSLLMLTITGCNNAQETAGSAGSSMLGAEVSDTDVTKKVKIALLHNDAVKHFDIDVYTTKGVVRLTGILDNQNQIDQAFMVTRAIAGVLSIRDELTLKQ